MCPAKFYIKAVRRNIPRLHSRSLGNKSFDNTLRWSGTQDRFWIPVKILVEYVSLMLGLPGNSKKKKIYRGTLTKDFQISYFVTERRRYSYAHGPMSKLLQVACYDEYD